MHRTPKPIEHAVTDKNAIFKYHAWLAWAANKAPKLKPVKRDDCVVIDWNVDIQ